MTAVLPCRAFRHARAGRPIDCCAVGECQEAGVAGSQGHTTPAFGVPLHQGNTAGLMA